LLLSETYREQNRRLHESRSDYGTSGDKWAAIILQAITEGDYKSILDYGSGKGRLAEALARSGHAVAEYDPAILGKDAPPEPAELVICGDVLEHIEPECLDEVIADLRRLAKRKLIVIIDMLPSDKLLPDGRNTHLIVEDAAWWGAKFSATFDVLDWRIGGRKIYGELAPKLPGKLPVKRRTAPADWSIQIEFVRAQINHYADPFSRVATVNMWEGVDDEVADMQVVVWIIEHMSDVAAAIRDIACLTSKAAMFVIDLKAGHDARYWHQMIGQCFRVGSSRIDGDTLNIIASPKLAVQGLKTIGAVDGETRWEQAKVAMARYKKRIPVAPPHGRLAVLACYGPSLGDTIEDLRLEALAPDADVISVSGSHDFLLERGIAPDFHAECDPRAHKADNIAAYNPGTRYLLASCIHPVLFDKLGPDADIALWHVASMSHSAELIDKLGEKPGTLITGGGSVGLRSIALLYAMGYRRFSIYGMDCSFRDDGGMQHAGKHAGKRQNVCTYRCGDRVFSTSNTLQSYATDFIEMVQRVNDLDVRLHGDGLLQAMVAGLDSDEEDGQH
jgi:6-hydroxymethylpterin diphosphokinase MptE-like protein/methyltransferase family protein